MDIDEPPYVHGEQGERSAQVFNIDTSKHVAAITLCAIIAGVSATIAIVCGCVAWSTTAQYQVILNHETKIEARLDRLEGEANADRRK